MNLHRGSFACWEASAYCNTIYVLSNSVKSVRNRTRCAASPTMQVCRINLQHARIAWFLYFLVHHWIVCWIFVPHESMCKNWLVVFALKHEPQSSWQKTMPDEYNSQSPIHHSTSTRRSMAQTLISPHAYAGCSTIHGWGLHYIPRSARSLCMWLTLVS